MTARVLELLRSRHEEMEKPRWGWVFPSFDDAKRHTTYNTMKCAHDRVIDSLKGNLERFTLYPLRHTVLTRLREANVDAFTIQKIAGHSSIVISQRYVYPTGERVEDAFSKLEAYNSKQVASASKESA